MMIDEKISRWLRNARVSRRDQSGKNCAIQGVRLIWKQTIWLAICEFLFHNFSCQSI